MTSETMMQNSPEGTPRHFIKDMCDFCKKLAYVRSGDMKKRLQGFTFGCEECRAKNLFKWSIEHSRGSRVIKMYQTNNPEQELC